MIPVVLAPGRQRATTSGMTPLLQDPLYHAFAARQTILGIPNFWNVVSNLAFLFAALFGLRALRTWDGWERIAYVILLAGTAAIAVGSAYYHLAPDNARLFWDRLPMTVVFMSLLALVIGDRRLLAPLLLFGAASVIYWRLSGDLRLYALVQFGTLLAVPIFALRRPDARAIWWTAGLYGIAKVFELLDKPIAAFIATGGHPWKHLAAAAALAVYCAARNSFTFARNSGLRMAVK